jgi:hypothetical protein
MELEKVKVLPQEKLEGLIEPEIYGRLSKDEYPVYKADSHELLTYKRFGIPFKLIFLQMLDKCYEYGEEVYLNHIRAFSYGTFTEPGNPEKVTKDKFVETFINIYEEISNAGFNVKKSVLPLSSKLHIKNGSHRLAAAIYSNEDVYCIKTENLGPNFNYRFFYERDVKPDFMDAAAVVFAEFSVNSNLAIIWPGASAGESEIESILQKIVYKKKVALTDNGADNLIQLLMNKNSGKEYSLLRETAEEVFNKDNTITIYLFQADENEMSGIEEQLRTINQDVFAKLTLVKDSEVVLNFSRLFFNIHALHFLNYAHADKYPDWRKKIADFKKAIDDSELDVNDFVIDSGILLEMYGIRPSDKINYISPSDDILLPDNTRFVCHNDLAGNYNVPVSSLIYDPRNHFNFFGVKFVSFNNLYAFKKKRAAGKDVEDLKLMDELPLIKRKRINPERIKQKLYYYYHLAFDRTEKFAGNTLRKVGLYDLINKYYLKVKAKTK